MDECCAVCAEPLEWTGYGPCGHLQTCSKCVARLRFVLKDKRCPICQQESEMVFFTRHLGSFSTRLTPEQFHELQGGRMYKYLSIVNGYFDDQNQFRSIKALCAYWHPELAGSGERKFQNLRELKKCVKEELGKQFCEICLAFRKVFVCEQLLYTPKEARRHMSQGDLHGPLAVGGFKGHPMCEFCRSRFFSETELFKHNSERHETCFICRREQPQTYRYYRDVEELEEHFRKEHFPCTHPYCIEARFVVFRTEAELRQHVVEVHERRDGGRSQRVAIETNFQVGRAVRGGRGRFHLDARQEYAPSHRAAEVPVQDPAGFSEQRLVELTEADFPSFIDAPTSTQSTWPVRGNRMGLGMSSEQFPSLPGQESKRSANQKRGDSMAARVAANRSPMRSSVQQLPNPNLQPVRARDPQPERPVQRPSSPPSWPHRRQKVDKTPEQQKESSAWVTLSRKTEAKDRAEEFPALLGDASAVQKSSVHPSWPHAQERPKAMQATPQTVQGSRVHSFEMFEQIVSCLAPSVTDVQAFPSLSGSRTASSQQIVPSAAGSKVSEGLKAANKVLIKKLKNQMDKATFQEFHREADVFLRQSLSAEGFHARLVDYGLAHYIAEIANLCPSAAKRSELLDVHSKFLQQCKQDPAHAPAFVPVSVLEASFRQAMEKPTWMCPRCSTLNMADADFCEACDAAHGAHPLRPERIPPSPIVYRKSPAQQRMLFGVDDRKQGSKAWNKRSR